MRASVDTVSVFKSIHHPGSSSPSLVFARNFVRPLAACMLPVMILTLVDVLRGYPALPYLIWGFPLATAIALVWTSFRMRTTAAEIAVSGAVAGIRTVFDVARRAPLDAGEPVLDVRKSRHHFEFALGGSSYEFADREWPELPELLEALRAARSSVNFVVSTDRTRYRPAVEGEA